MTHVRLLGIIVLTLFLEAIINNVQARKSLDDAYEVIYSRDSRKEPFEGALSRNEDVDDDDYFDDENMGEDVAYFRYEDDFPEIKAFSDDFDPELPPRSSKKLELDGEDDILEEEYSKLRPKSSKKRELDGEDDILEGEDSANDDDDSVRIDEQNEDDVTAPEEDENKSKGKKSRSQSWNDEEDEDSNVSSTDDEDDDYHRGKPKIRPVYRRRYGNNPYGQKNEKRQYSPHFVDRGYNGRYGGSQRDYEGRFSRYGSSKRNFGKQETRFRGYPKNPGTGRNIDYERNLGWENNFDRNPSRGNVGFGGYPSRGNIGFGDNPSRGYVGFGGNPSRGNVEFGGNPNRNVGYGGYPSNQGMGNEEYERYPMNQEGGIGMYPGSSGTYWRSVEGLGGSSGEAMNQRGMNLGQNLEEVRKLLLKLLSEENQS